MIGTPPPSVVLLSLILGIGLTNSPNAHAQSAAPFSQQNQAVAPSVVQAPTTTPAQSKRDLYHRLESTNAELEKLRHQRRSIGIGGPIALLSVGGAVALIGLIGGVTASSTSDICNSSYSGCESPSAGPYWAMAGLGAAVAIGGGIWLGNNVSARREFDPRIRELERERQDLDNRLRYGVALSREGAVLRLGLRF